MQYAFVSPELVILLTTGPRRILFKPFYLKHLLDKDHAETANKDMYSIISCQFPPNITIIIKDGVGCGCGLQGGCGCVLQGGCRVWQCSPRRVRLWSTRRVYGVAVVSKEGVAVVSREVVAESPSRV